MNSTNKLLLLLLVLSAASLNARMSRIWSYADLREAADLVVIAKPHSNTDTQDVFDNQKEAYTGINTEFEVEDVIKGKIAAHKFIVLHFKERGPAADGMEVIKFRLKPYRMEVTSVQTEGEPPEKVRAVSQLPAPEYLLFLKRRDDGRYEPVTGQMDASFSVKEIGAPFPWAE